MYGQNITASERKAATKSTTVMANGHEFAKLTCTRKNANDRDDADQRKDEAPGTVEEEASSHAGPIDERHHDGNAQDRNNRAGKHRYATARPAA